MHISEIEAILNKKINEMSVAQWGDWNPKKDLVGERSKLIIDKDWVKIDTLKIKKASLELYKHKNKESYILGNWFYSITESKSESEQNYKFGVLLGINLSEMKSIQSRFKFNKKVYNVDGVQVDEDKRTDGLAKEVYKYLVSKKNILLIGDEYQYFGARRLWSRLSKETDLIVDIIDVDKDNILVKNATIHHGIDDWDFDERVWSYTAEKKHIRLILKDIKG